MKTGGHKITKGIKKQIMRKEETEHEAEKESYSISYMSNVNRNVIVWVQRWENI